MNKIGFPKRLSMGWTNYVRLMSLLVFLGLSLCAATAQEKAQLDFDRLVGVDPADIVTDENNYRINVYYQTKEEEKNNELNGLKKTFFLMNVGTQKFFNIGGSFGLHASLKDYGMYLWLYSNTGASNTYNIRTGQNLIPKTSTDKGNPDNSDSYVQYEKDGIGDKYKQKPGVYPDCEPTDTENQYGWVFEQAADYNAETNKVYYIKTYGDRYLTAVPNEKDGNLCQAIPGKSTTNDNYQVWKLVTLEQYYDLFNETPSNSDTPIDATFLLKNPDLNYTKRTNEWQVSGTAHFIRFGVEDFWKKSTESYYKKTVNGKDIETDDRAYLLENGKYFCADIKAQHNVRMEQWITVNKPGWYVVRCNGFSNTNGLAKLYIKEYWKTFFGLFNIEPVETTLKKYSGQIDLLDAGKTFYNGEYSNEVKIHITEELFKFLKTNSISDHTSLILGISVGGNENVSAEGEWTAVDNFRLLYYDATPELVLDEENPDLNYLTETSDAYENVTLHLNRSFSLNKWNTLTLPVSLTYGQMKSAFGNDVLLAKLDELTATSVRFQTVNCTNDNDIMLEAFTPYIIKPTKGADAATEAYTTPRLKKSPNQFWLASGVGETNAEDGVTRHTSGKVEVKAGHYTIDGVTLDREALKTNLDNHWVSTTTTTTPTTATSASKMVCKGTMAKTYYVDSSKKGRFYTDNDEKRDNLAGDYFMKDGTMYKVPAGKQYGLKAFRCWFELSKTTDNTASTIASAKDVSLFIDDIKDGVTGIDDITTDPNSSNAKNLSGVYNIYGQRLSNGSSLDNLPQGIYIVNGKKVRK